MYQQEYQRKRISMDQLLELFQSDLFIVLGSGPQSPVGLLSRLHELQGRASHIRLSTALPLKPYPVMTDPQYRGILEQESFFYSPVQRRCKGEHGGRAAPLPRSFHRARQHTAVPQVHAVKIAKSHTGARAALYRRKSIVAVQTHTSRFSMRAVPCSG